MDDKEDFESACFHAAGWFLAEKVPQGCVKSEMVYYSPELAEGYQSNRIPKGQAVKVTVEFVATEELVEGKHDSFVDDVPILLERIRQLQESNAAMAESMQHWADSTQAALDSQRAEFISIIEREAVHYLPPCYWAEKILIALRTMANE